MNEPSPRRLSASVAVALMIGAIMLASRPFTGVRHDGILYLGEALARTEAHRLHDDLYFAFGSQGRFTIVPLLYECLIRAFGIGGGTIVGLLVCFALFAAASAWLVAALVPRSRVVPSIVAVVLGWSLYGGLRVFAYGEAFLTARSLCEPFVLFALAAWLRDRRGVAAIALAIGLAVHPLMALAGAAVMWAMLVIDDRRWLFAAVAGVVAVAICGAIGFGPFADVAARYDPEWLALVRVANVHAFVLQWSPLDFGVIVFDVVVVAYARPAYGARGRAFATAALWTGVGSVVLSLAMVDGLGSAFFGKLQVWRVLWVLQWVAMASTPVALVRLWQRGEHGRVAATFLAIGWMAMFSVAPGILAVLAVLIDRFRDRFALSRTTARIVLGVGILVALTIAAQYEARVIKMGLLLDADARTMIGQAIGLNLLSLVFAALFLRYATRRTAVALVVGAVAFAGSAAAWDQRGVWQRKLESYPLDANLWPGLIEPKARVYWYRDLLAPWILLGHGNYYTIQQSSGAVFSRAMTVELEKRRKLTALLDFQEQICRMMNNLSEKQTSCEPDAEAVKALCVDGGVDDVVLQSRLEGHRPTADFATGVFENGYEKKFFLYRCSALNKG